MEFLRELAGHNEREWFAANKGRYEAQVLEPVLAFIRAMRPRLAEISPHFLAEDRRVGGSMFRIYRDTRFSRDKSPYKTHVGIRFAHRLARRVAAPSFYVHLEPANVFLGVGCYHPQREALYRIRSHLAAHPRSWRRAVENRAFRRLLQLEGDCLKRPPRGFAADHPLIEDLKRKDFIALRRLDEKLLFHPTLPECVAQTFQAAAPFMRFLCRALDVPF